MNTLTQDIRFSWCLLAARPLLSATTVLTLALGLGACAAVLTLVDEVLLSPLPYRAPEDLVVLWETQPGENSAWKVASLPMADDWKARVPEIVALVVNRPWRPILARGERYESLWGAKVGVGFFDLLGIRPMLGRLFLPADDQPGASKVVVLGHSLWQRDFGGDPEVIGRTVQLDDSGSAVAAEVVGILPPHPSIYRPVVFEDAEIWMPLALNPLHESRGQRMYRVIARLAPGVTIEALRHRLDTVAIEVAGVHPETNRAWGGAAESLVEQMISSVRPALLVLLLAVAFVFLIACTNTGVFLMVQEAARSKEIATRLVLGARPVDVGRQLFLEVLMLTCAGCIPGLLLARGILDSLGFLGFEAFPRGQEITVGFRIVVVAVGLALATAIFFGLAQTLRVSRSSFLFALQTGHGGAARGLCLRRLLVLAEVTWSLILLVAAGLMLRSFHQLMEVDPGFKAERVLTLRIEMAPSLQPKGVRLERSFEGLLETVESLPGVYSAGLVDHLPMQGVARSTVAWSPGAARSGEDLRVEFRGISHGYFQSMGIPMLSGSDLDTEPQGKQIMVGKAAAELLWPGEQLEDLVGRDLHLSWGEPGLFRVVGVVGDVRGHDLREMARPEVYLPYTEVSHRSMTLVVRTNIPPEHLVGDLGAWGRTYNHILAIDQVQTLTQVIHRTMVEPRAYAMLLTGFALVALLLTAGGIFSAVSYSVMQRRGDWSVRLALGARPRDLVRGTVAEGLSDALAGVLLGLGGALFFARLLSGFLFGVSMIDPWTLGCTATLMIVVVVLASYFPAKRATKMDPAVVLRQA
jgi:predicted permease